LLVAAVVKTVTVLAMVAVALGVYDQQLHRLAVVVLLKLHLV
jgi:hypothetical protein